MPKEKYYLIKCDKCNRLFHSFSVRVCPYSKKGKHVCFWCCKLCRYVKWVGCFEHCGYQKTKEDNT